MASFTFVRDGVTYQVSGPSGSTESEALAVLDAQLISGSLVGQKPGTVLDLQAQVKSGLNLVGVQIPDSTLPAVDQLDDSIPPDVVSTADIVEQKPGQPVGTLDSSQVRGLLAQRAKTVAQSFSAVSDAKGVGKYGLNINQLEKTGLVKPGTSKLVSSGLNLTKVLQNPGCWTGKDNIVKLTDLTSNPAAQQTAQQTVYSQALGALTSKGLIPPNIVPKDLGAVLNTATNFNVETASKWLQGQLPGEVQGAINTVAKAGQYATAASKTINLVGSGSYASAIAVAGSALGVSSSTLATANRALSVFQKVADSNTAIGSTLRNSLGSFGSSLPGVLGPASEVGKLLSGGPEGIVGAVSGAISGNLGSGLGTVVSSLTNQLGSVPGLSAVSSQVTGALQSLAGNSNLANLATAVGQGNIPGLGNIAGALGNIPGLSNITGALGNIPGLGNLSGALSSIPGLGNLSGALSSIPGLSNIPGLGNLVGGLGGNIPGLGNLVGALGGNIPGLGNLVGALGGNIPGLGNLVGALTGGGAASLLGPAANLLGLGNIGGALGSLGSLSGLSGLAGALGPASAVFSVFGGFGGGGKGDASGLNFSLDAPSKPVESFENTVNRATVNSAVSRIIGDARVSALSFGSALQSKLAPVKVDVSGIQVVKNLIGAVQAKAAQQNAVEAFAGEAFAD